MTPFPKSTFGMDGKFIVLLQLLQKQVKKWDQNISRAKIFLFIVKFKKLRFTYPLKIKAITSSEALY